MKRVSTRILLALTAGALVSATIGCKEDEPPPPLPSAKPTEEPAPPLTLEVEDAGAPEEDAGEEKKKAGGPRKPAASLENCCSALLQNSASAPEPTAAYMKTAAATCSAMVSEGKGKASVLSAIQGALQGAGMPAACK